MSYQAFALLLDGSDFDMDTAMQRLAEQFADVKIAEFEDSLELTLEDWCVYLRLVESPEVRAHSADIAERHAGERADQDAIATCARRIEISTDDDPGQEHGDDYVRVLRTLETFGRVVFFEPVNECFV